MVNFVSHSAKSDTIGIFTYLWKIAISPDFKIQIDCNKRHSKTKSSFCESNEGFKSKLLFIHFKRGTLSLHNFFLLGHPLLPLRMNLGLANSYHFRRDVFNLCQCVSKAKAMRPSRPCDKMGTPQRPCTNVSPCSS